jgi:hypothetical protein
MAVSAQTRSGDLSEALSTESTKTKEAIRVALPGIIQSFNPATVTAEIQPSIQYTHIDNDGTVIQKDYPLLVDVPVIFPRGGGCTLTFPVRKGDECLVVFADRCIDFWWQSGDVQKSGDPRMHDLSDGFAIVGPMSQRYKIGNISTSAAQLRTDDGSAFIELAAGGAVTITSPQVTINGPVQVNGTITSTGDQTAAGISQVNHTHGGVQSGNSNTGKPQ